MRLFTHQNGELFIFPCVLYIGFIFVHAILYMIDLVSRVILYTSHLFLHVILYT